MSYEFADGYQIRDQAGTHFLTFTVMGWVDIFSRKVYRDIILDSFSFCRQHKGLLLGGYVIMTNHVHAIWTAKNENLSDIVRDFKSFTSKRILETMQSNSESRREWLDYMFKFFASPSNRHENYRFWTGNNHPEHIYSLDFLMTKLNYTHLNPVRAGIVELPEQYIYSSASNYILGKGIIEIDYLY
jgi:putative transposase